MEKPDTPTHNQQTTTTKTQKFDLNMDFFEDEVLGGTIFDIETSFQDEADGFPTTEEHIETTQNPRLYDDEEL